MDVDPREERVLTRAKNKDQRPGQIELAGRAKRRTRVEIEEEKRVQEAKKKETEMKKKAVIKRITELEDDMAIQDKTVGRSHPRSRKDMHLEDSDVVDIPSDDSVPPQPKKKRMSKHGDGVTAPKPRGKLSTGKGKGITTEDPTYADQSDSNIEEAPRPRNKSDKNTFNRKAQLELASDNEPTEPEDSPVEEKPVGRHLKRSNAIALITIPSQAGKVTQNEASEQEDDNGSKPAHESGADWEMVEHGIDGNDDETPKANKRLTKPKPRESIKAAGRHKVLESDLEDNMEVCESEVNTTTAPDTSNTYNAIKKWTSHVAKTNRSSKSSGSASISTLVPSKRTTSSSSAVVSKTRSQPEKKKIKLDNQDVATSTMILEEDEAVEREAALSSPIKGKKRLNNKTIVKVEDQSPAPKRSGANRKYTNADLPNGAMNNNIWRKKVIPTYIQYLAGQNVKETWTIEDDVSVGLLQTIWNFTYGGEVPHTIKVNGPAFSIADQRICEWRAGIGSTAVAIVKAFIEGNPEEYNTNAACQKFAEEALENYGFLYGAVIKRDGKIKRKDIFRGPLVIQTFTSHLNSTRGAQVITTLGPPGNSAIALALAAAAVERVLTFWRDGFITLESIAEDKKGKGIRKTVNAYTGKGTKTTDFNHGNWRGATNGYLASINANIANGRLVWKRVISDAMEFAKSNVNEDLVAGAGDDMDDERALLVADSDSDLDLS